jgi:hypothetical protein
LFPISAKLVIKNFGNGTKEIAGISASNISVSNKISTYGEYKLQLATTHYKTCRDIGSGYALSKFETFDQACEDNLAVTNPYVIQKNVL